MNSALKVMLVYKFSCKSETKKFLHPVVPPWVILGSKNKSCPIRLKFLWLMGNKMIFQNPKYFLNIYLHSKVTRLKPSPGFSGTHCIWGDDAQTSPSHLNARQKKVAPPKLGPFNYSLRGTQRRLCTRLNSLRYLESDCSASTRAYCVHSAFLDCGRAFRVQRPNGTCGAKLGTWGPDLGTCGARFGNLWGQIGHL